MNQQKTPRQGTPQHVGRPIRLPKKCAPPTALVIATITTAILLVISLMVLCIALIVGVDEPVSTDGDGGGGKPSKVTQTDTNTPSNTTIPAKLQLPSQTVAGNYLSTGDGTLISGVDSQHAVLVSMTKNTAVASKAADTVIHPASMTKIMTILVACERASSATDLLTVKQEMLDRRKALGGSGELVENTTVVRTTDEESLQIPVVGKSITVQDALHLINYQSDTVACLLIAEYIAGSEAEFVKLMNQKAAEIGLTKTNFVNCTGLTEQDQEHNVTTCREMAAIMACAMNNPTAKKVITSTEKYTVKIYENGQETTYTIPFYADWHNKRLGGQTSVGKVEICGGKTGYEDIPTACLVTYAKHSNGEEYVCVTVGRTGEPSPKLTNPQAATDTKSIYKNYAK